MFGGAGLAAGITVGALLAQQMLGTDAFAGLPTAMFTLGSALAAFIVGKLSQRYGRRIGLATGFIVGGFIMYLTMLCLGELTVAMPVSGS
ncbi:hypothetical protein ACT4US_35345, partial [Bacillus sp. HC-Mk]